jgi:hypothetical protein
MMSCHIYIESIHASIYMRAIEVAIAMTWSDSKWCTFVSLFGYTIYALEKCFPGDLVARNKWLLLTIPVS